jgi:hypothetical protein
MSSLKKKTGTTPHEPVILIRNQSKGALAAAQWHLQPADRSSALLIGLHHDYPYYQEQFLT